MIRQFSGTCRSLVIVSYAPVLLLSLLWLSLVPAWGQNAALTITMRLAEVEWQVMRQDVIPPFEVTCQCRVQAIGVLPEVLGQRLRAMQQAGRIEIVLFAQDNYAFPQLISQLAAVLAPMKKGLRAED